MEMEMGNGEMGNVGEMEMGQPDPSHSQFDRIYDKTSRGRPFREMEMLEMGQPDPSHSQFDRIYDKTRKWDSLEMGNGTA
jgi:hypothetical protein